MENGKKYVAPVLTKREPTKMLTPYCIKCAKEVDRWLYHMHGHTDGTPILVLSCHFESITVGASPAGADEFRKQMNELYLPGLAKVYWNADGTVNGPTEQAPKAAAVYTNHRKEREPDLGDF